MNSPRIVLASASPRRFELLSGLGVPFEVIPTHCDEPAPTGKDGGDPGSYVERLARLKAEASSEAGLIIGADTVVELGGNILNKPRDKAEAVEMLSLLQGRTHRVFTGLCLVQGDQVRVAHQITSVTFGKFGRDFLQRYVDTGEPMDKAGAYAAQGRGALLVEKLEGDYWNVVGLPLNLLARLLQEFGVVVQDFWSAP